MTNMCKGSIPRHLFFYAVPLILGNIFQLTYNAVDSIILGRFSGKSALAAVGVANPIMNILIFLIVGICLGAGVLMSEFYGAGNYKRLKHEISTTITIGFIITLIMTISCIIFIRPILFLAKTPENLMAETSLYLRMVFGGLIFTFFYNIFATTLRAVGDSRTPIICVSISAVLNGVLDYILVAKFAQGIFGAAIATVTSQAVSCFLCTGYVYLKQPLLAVKISDFKVDSSLIKSTLSYSWATAMQQTVLHIGKLLVQSAVNPLGVDSIAAFNAGTKIDDFAYQPGQNIGHSMTTLIAQNRGAGLVKRERAGFKWGMLMEITYGICIFALVALSRGFLIRLFVNAEEINVIQLGKQYLLLMACFYVLPCITNGLQGFFRGMGNMKVTVICTTAQMIGRVGFSYLLAPKYGIPGIAWACFFGWILMLLVEVPQVIHTRRTILKEN